MVGDDFIVRQGEGVQAAEAVDPSLPTQSKLLKSIHQ
jgi:hypothetical protein